MISVFPIVHKEEYLLSGQYDREGRLFLHFEWTGDTWTKLKYQQLLEDWADILDAFVASGISEVFSAVPKDQDKIRKWQTLFGLEPVAENDEAVFYRLGV